VLSKASTSIGAPALASRSEISAARSRRSARTRSSNAIRTGESASRKYPSMCTSWPSWTVVISMPRMHVNPSRAAAADAAGTAAIVS
jgi:hypothetical protein